jgi:hypothetical protein
MAAITTRSTAGTGATVKNSTLTNAEVDNNFINLNVDIQTRLLKTGGTNLYIGSQANSTRFPNSITVFSSVASGIQKNESHNIGLASENTGSFLAKTIVTGSSGGTTITLSDVAGIYIGQVVSATGVASEAIITNINTGTNVVTLSIANTGIPSGTANIIAYGVGAYGIGYTSGGCTGIGVIGEAHVNISSASGRAIGVKGYSNDTHASGSNIGLYGSAENGLTNYSLYLNEGDIYSKSAVNKTWYLNSNLTFSSVSGSYSVTIPQLVLGIDLAVSQGGTGASSFTTNAVLLGNGGGSFQTVSPGTSGNVLLSNGSTWISSTVSSSFVTTALGFTPYNSTNPNGYISGITYANVISALGFTPYNSTNPSVYITSGGITYANVISALGFTPYNSTNPNGYISGITSGNVTTALGFTPYNSTNPNGYISGITSGKVITALGFTPYNSTNPNGYISGITSGKVITALGFTPYNSTNPNGYITSAGSADYANSSGSADSATTFTSTTQNSRFKSLGVGTNASEVTGEIRATGNITGFFSSDKKYKDNIRDIDGVLEKVVSIGSKYFDWTDDYINDHGGEDGYFVQKSDFGVVAQDVQAVFPQAVKQREDGSLAVDYARLGVLSFGAISELQKQINELKEIINKITS